MADNKGIIILGMTAAAVYFMTRGKAAAAPVQQYVPPRQPGAYIPPLATPPIVPQNAGTSQILNILQALPGIFQQPGGAANPAPTPYDYSGGVDDTSGGGQPSFPSPDQTGTGYDSPDYSTMAGRTIDQAIYLITRRSNAVIRFVKDGKTYILYKHRKGQKPRYNLRKKVSTKIIAISPAQAKHLLLSATEIL